MNIKLKWYTIFEYGKWHFQFAIWKPNKDQENGIYYAYIPFSLSFGYGRMNSLDKSIWFSVCLFNKNIKEGEQLNGLHIKIPCRKYIYEYR